MPIKLGQIRDIGIAILLCIIGVWVVYHYQSKVSSVDSTADAETPTITDSPVQQLWQKGPHADTYVVDANGENSYCARCHSPVNFVPAMDELPESCTVCKFKVEEPPPLFRRDEWLAIDCKVCHRIDRNGAVHPEYTWLAVAAIDEYEKVDTTTELCQKCHTGADDLPSHTDIHVSGAHEGFLCTDCHDAHDTASSCSAAGCHEAPENLAAHDEMHQNVSCVACHDASGMAVGPSEEFDGVWLTLVSATPDEAASTIPHTSHNIQREVNCARCHFADNPWNLSAEVESAP